MGMIWKIRMLFNMAYYSGMLYGTARAWDYVQTMPEFQMIARLIS